MNGRATAVVTIDGPAGAGKSTVARRLADRLGYLLLDSGALYRAVALSAERAGLDLHDEAAVASHARQLVARGALRMEPGIGAQTARVLVDAEDWSEAIRTPEISQAASLVSSRPAVRAALLDLQRQLGRQGGVVAEGRDMGTVVFPDATAKFFLTASIEVRAQRRHDELRAKGRQVELEQTRREVVERDRADAERPVAPLRQAADALLVDSTGRSIEDVVAEMAEVVGERLGG